MILLRTKEETPDPSPHAEETLPGCPSEQQTLSLPPLSSPPLEAIHLGLVIGGHALQFLTWPD